MIDTEIILWMMEGFVILIIIGYIISIYNSFIRIKNNIDKAWSNIDVLLKQRHDELINVMETVKGYARYEKKVLTQVTQARTSFMNATSLQDKAKADNMMKNTLKNMFAVAENYPELKANENFIQFQKRITDIENDIADRREFYNDAVNIFNTRLNQIPYNLIGKMLHYTPKEFFKVEDNDKNNITTTF